MAIILVVDDELGIRGLLSEILSDEGHTVELAENAAQARAVRGARVSLSFSSFMPTLGPAAAPGETTQAH